MVIKVGYTHVTFESFSPSSSLVLPGQSSRHDVSVPIRPKIDDIIN